MKSKIAAIANYSGITDSYGWARRKLTKSQVAILVYHRVCPHEEAAPLRSTSPDDFVRQMKYFRHNFEILSLETLAKHLRSGDALPSKAVVITFDDGYKDNYRYAYPALKASDIPATVFLTTGHINSDKLLWWDEVRYVLSHTKASEVSINGDIHSSLKSAGDRDRVCRQMIGRMRKLPEEVKRSWLDEMRSSLNVTIPAGISRDLLLDWNEVREMSQSGVSFGAHTVNHPILTKVPLDQAREEIIQSKKVIEAKIDREVTTFAYPNGNHNSGLMQLLQEAGFSCAVALTPRKLISPNDGLYNLPRMSVLDHGKFKVMFSGLWGDLERLGIIS